VKYHGIWAVAWSLARKGYSGIFTLRRSVIADHTTSRSTYSLFTGQRLVHMHGPLVIARLTA
jgi:hypothetical protein